MPLNREIGSRPKTGDQSRQSGGLTRCVPVMRSLSNTYSNNTIHHRQFRYPNADNFCFRQALEMIGGARLHARNRLRKTDRLVRPGREPGVIGLRRRRRDDRGVFRRRAPVGGMALAVDSAIAVLAGRCGDVHGRAGRMRLRAYAEQDSCQDPGCAPLEPQAKCGAWAKIGRARSRCRDDFRSGRASVLVTVAGRRS